MPKLSSQLAALRTRKGATAGTVSAHTGFDTSGIYAIEHGRRDARESTLEAIAGALGARILVVDTDHRASVADAASEIAAHLAKGSSHAAAQVLVQAYADLISLDALGALALAYEPPGSIDEQWDAALAGIVDVALAKHHATAPTWVHRIAGDPSAKWDPWTGGKVPGRAEDIPEPLRRRGVWIEEAELTSA